MPLPPPVAEAATSHSAPFPPPSSRYPRFSLPLILAVSASVLAVSAYQYGKYSATTHPSTPARLPPLTTPTTTTDTPASIPSLHPTSRLPVLLSSTPSSTPSSLSFHPLLRHVAPFGLPALPYTSAEGRYAYPLLVREGYVCQWNVRTRNADWVMEILNCTQPASTPPPLTRSASTPAITTIASAALPPASPAAPTRDLSTFRTDPLLSPASSPPTPTLYLNSSYDRGHLIPAASAASTSQSAMDETFYMTNISPQHPHCNRGYWRAIEGWLRETARRWYDTHGPSATLTVITGPLWLEEGQRDGKVATEGKDGGRRYVRFEVIPRAAPLVAVPTHFFKVLLATSESTSPMLTAFVVPNAPINASVPLQSFVSSVAAIESNSGWHFFPLLARCTTSPSTITTTADQPTNVIDVAELLLGASEDGRGRGLSELERTSVLELCKSGGCDLSGQWRKIEQWDEFNRNKRKRGRRVRSPSTEAMPLPNDTASRETNVTSGSQNTDNSASVSSTS